MEIKDEFKKINIDEYNEYAIEDGQDRKTKDYFALSDEVNRLSLHTSIAHMNQIVLSTDEKPIIGTQALDTCFGILFYDRKNKFGICGHATPNNINGIVVEMLKQIPIDDSQREIEYIIVPGFRSIEQRNFKAADEIIDILNTYAKLFQNIKFISLKTNIAPVMPEGLLSYEFAFDTSRGIDVTDIVFKDLMKEVNTRRI